MAEPTRSETRRALSLGSRKTVAMSALVVVFGVVLGSMLNDRGKRIGAVEKAQAKNGRTLESLDPHRERFDAQEAVDMRRELMKAITEHKRETSEALVLIWVELRLLHKEDASHLKAGPHGSVRQELQELREMIREIPREKVGGD